MIPLVAAIVLAGAAGAGPVLVSDACGGDTTDNADARCAVAEVERVMKSKKRPKELKVESDGKLYSVPADVEMVSPPSKPFLEVWWKVPDLSDMITYYSSGSFEFLLKVAALINSEKQEKKVPSSESACLTTVDSVRKESSVESQSVGDHSCQICFEHDHSTVMLPCGHGGVCWDCGVQMFALTEECPMCRKKIDLLVRVDTSKRREVEDEEFVSVVCAE